MNFFSFISPKKYSRLLNRTHLLNGMYIFFMSVIILSIVFTFIRSIGFLLRMFDETLWVSEKDITSSVASFDTEKLASFAPKLGITVPSNSGTDNHPMSP